jgi:hypothetical protein
MNLRLFQRTLAGSDSVENTLGVDKPKSIRPFKAQRYSTCASTTEGGVGTDAALGCGAEAIIRLRMNANALPIICIRKNRPRMISSAAARGFAQGVENLGVRKGRQKNAFRPHDPEPRVRANKPADPGG